MKIFRAFKTELDPNDRQKTLLLQHAGAARVAYNWGLERKQEAWAARRAAIAAGVFPNAAPKVPTWIDLSRELTLLKDVPKEDGGFSWMRGFSTCAPREALWNLDRAYADFFRRCKAKSKRKGFPRFKSRKRGIGGFRLKGAIHANVAHVQLPRLGRLRLKEHGYLPGDVKILSATITEKAGRWFVSLQVEQEILDPTPRLTHVVGVDVGIKSLAVTSDGEVFENPKALRTAEARLRRLQKSVSRKTKGSSNRKKAVVKAARLHHRIGNVRKDAMHKASSAIVKSASVIVLESLNVSGMLQNRKLSKALQDASLAELHRQLEYKARWQGVTVLKADRFFPSSKACSGCGLVKQDLALGDRTYECACGLRVDRDLNAAINLKNLAASSAVTACGEVGSGPCRVIRTKPASAKQEPNSGRGSSSIWSV